MFFKRSLLPVVLILSTFTFTGCAGLGCQPVEVMVAGAEPLQGQGLELRMLVKLRIQNPNDTPLDFSGVYVRMDVQGKRFAGGVSDAGGSVPRYGEKVISVPVSISTLQIARQALSLMTGEYPGKIGYELTGKLGGSLSGCMRFKSKGEFSLPETFLEERDQ